MAMKGPVVRGALQLILMGLSLVLAGCDGLVYVRGVVRNPHGEPVSGAKIHVTDIWYTETDANGCFNTGGTTDPFHSSEPLTIVAPGYKKASTKVRTSHQESRDCNVSSFRFSGCEPNSVANFQE